MLSVTGFLRHCDGARAAEQKAPLHLPDTHPLLRLVAERALAADKTPKIKGSLALNQGHGRERNSAQTCITRRLLLCLHIRGKVIR